MYYCIFVLHTFFAMYASKMVGINRKLNDRGRLLNEMCARTSRMIFIEVAHACQLNFYE